MRLIQYLLDGQTRLGILDPGPVNGNGAREDGLADATVRDAARLLPGGPATFDDLIAGGEAMVEALRASLTALRESAEAAGPGLRLVDLELVAPIGRPGKIVAVGRNYREHAAEEGVAAPTSPLVFAKFPSSIVGPGADIAWRRSASSRVDFEAELAVVIGRRARDVAVADALDHVLGYACLDDVSARDLQTTDGQWTRAKSLDTFCPIGPFVVTSDEIPDPQALRISCLVNGERLQDATTAEMIFGVAELVAFISAYITLDPGDVIATGTPPGVGAFRDPPRYLEDGDEVVVEIEGVGRLTNRCRILPG